MRTQTFGGYLFMLLLLAGGCIVGDQITTMTIYPDGSADLVVFRSNLRSTQRGQLADKEIADYQQQFESQIEGAFVRVRDVGGEILEATWIRRDAPMANLVSAHLPDAAALERYWTARGEEPGSGSVAQFVRDGVRRRMTIRIAAPPDPNDSDPDNSAAVSTTDVVPLRQAQANGISETRIAVVNGSITSARGFTIANDRQSALADVQEIQELLRNEGGQAELYLEWEVEP